jgi:protein SCO1/2
MSNATRNRLTAALLAAICLATAVPVAAQQQMEPAEVLQTVRIDQRLGEQVPLDLRFRDEAGNSVRFGELLGDKPVILAPGYYDCPMLCGVTREGLVGALKTLDLNVGESFDVITVSIDPRETPQHAADSEADAIRRYRRDPERTADGWHALVGNSDSIEQLTEAIGFHYLYDEQRDEYAHAAGIMLLTPDGQLARYMYGIAYSGRDLRLGLVEASEGRIGTIADQVMLLCFHYDPVTGRYGFVIWSAIRMLGAVTVLLMAGAIVIMLRRERRLGVANA